MTAFRRIFSNQGRATAGKRGLFLCLLAFVVPVIGASQSITVEQLATRMTQGDMPFIVDVRRSHSYAESHIPNAVNIPVSLLASRRLPPIGEVVVYDAGLGGEDAAKAAELLRAKQGIEPMVLAGGYAAWETRSGVTTAESGFKTAVDPVISYQDLAANGGEGAVIYDLRKGKGRAGERLEQHFPKARIAQGSPNALLGHNNGKGRAAEPAAGENPFLKNNVPETDELVVLVDNDHATAAEMARRLQAGGFKRVVVLAGGETILEFDGRPGLERRSGGSVDFDWPGSDAEGDANDEAEGNP